MTESIAADGSVKPNGAAQTANQIVFLDFGSRSKSKIKRLRKGQGRLMDRVKETVAELAHDETIPANSPVVVVVVKQRRKSRGIFG